MAHLHREVRADSSRIAEPVHVAGDHATPQQLLARADDDRALAGAYVDHVHRLGKSARQAASLTNGEASETPMRPDASAVREDDRPW